MNFIFGLIIGVLVTIGGAYVHDAAIGTSGPDRESRVLVNWDVFNGDLRNLNETVSAGWDRLTGGRRRE